MKFRKGFVTNSSSSSFVCQICNYSATVYDGWLEDAGFVECENGHIFCEEHILEYPKNIKPNTDQLSLTEFPLLNKDKKYLDNEVRAEYCPICQFAELSNDDFFRYLDTLGINKEKTLKEIKEKYSDYEEFDKAMLDKKA